MTGMDSHELLLQSAFQTRLKFLLSPLTHPPSSLVITAAKFLSHYPLQFSKNQSTIASPAKDGYDHFFRQARISLMAVISFIVAVIYWHVSNSDFQKSQRPNLVNFGLFGSSFLSLGICFIFPPVIVYTLSLWLIGFFFDSSRS